MGERRNTTRHATRSLVLLLDEKGPRGDRCWMVNVSAGGVAVQAPVDTELEMDTTVAVELPLGRSVSRIRTTCRVVGLSGESPRIAHLQFVDTTELFRRTLASAVREWDRRTGEYEALTSQDVAMPAEWRDPEG